MRPRGPSSSSPVSWKAGQTALHMPQWTQARSTASARAPARVSASGPVTLARISERSVQAAGIEDPGRIQRRLQALVQAEQGGRQWLEHLHAWLRAAEQRGVAADLRRR